MHRATLCFRGAGLTRGLLMGFSQSDSSQHMTTAHRLCKRDHSLLHWLLLLQLAASAAHWLLLHLTQRV